MSSPGADPSFPSVEITKYCGLTSIFRSWFWRFYDHLFSLCLINLGWFSTCFGVYWIVLRLGFFEITGPKKIFWGYFFFLVECAVSLGWAIQVFRWFIEGQWNLKDFWPRIRKIFLRAMGVSAFSGIFIGWGIYNILFYFHLQSPHRFLDLCLAGFLFWLLLFWTLAALFQWPILFFQDPPFWKILYRSCLLVLANGSATLVLLFFYLSMGFFLTIAPFLWFFVGPVLFFSFQCVALEKHFLRYKISFKDKPLEPFLESLDIEARRGWREILKPWENR